jgi:hypothetical protein
MHHWTFIVIYWPANLTLLILCLLPTVWFKIASSCARSSAVLQIRRASAEAEGMLGSSVLWDDGGVICCNVFWVESAAVADSAVASATWAVAGATWADAKGM